MTQGLSGAEAEARANGQLGDPLALAEELMVSLRRSSWWGRHFVIGFGVLPVLAVPVLWALLLFLDLSLEFALGYGWDAKKLHVAADNPVAFHHLVMALRGADYVAIALVAFFFCWLVRRSAVNYKWMMAACGICSLYALFLQVIIKPHFFAIGVYWPPQWIRAAIPFLIAGAIYICQRHTARRFREKISA